MHLFFAALSGPDLLASGYALPHPAKRQRLGEQQPDLTAHNALLSAMLVGGGDGSSHHLGGRLNSGAFGDSGGIFNPGALGHSGMLNPAASNMTSQQQVYQEVLAAVSAVQSLQAHQDPAAAAAASQAALFAGQQAAAQAAAGGNPFAGAPQLLSASSASAGVGNGGAESTAAAAYLQAVQAVQQQAALQAAQQAQAAALMSVRTVGASHLLFCTYTP